MKFSLPSKYKNYGNIFFPAEYIKITENSQIAHAINLKENTITPYKPIYYLSEKELYVLRKYLEESQ
jgi:hypothetical protein